MGVFKLTPLLVLCWPKEGAVDSAFNEQSQALSPRSAGTAADRASVDLIM